MFKLKICSLIFFLGSNVILFFGVEYFDGSMNVYNCESGFTQCNENCLQTDQLIEPDPFNECLNGSVYVQYSNNLRGSSCNYCIYPVFNHLSTTDNSGNKIVGIVMLVIGSIVAVFSAFLLVCY